MPPVIASFRSALVFAAIIGFILLPSARAAAQWWSRAPADFEDCADAAEKASTKADKTAALSDCNAKFAGRRKPGGGYTYFDFMQDRSFDIAGPNPTPEEQKTIDEQYTVYLENQRRSTIAAAFAARQQQLRQASFDSETDKIPAVAPSKPPAATIDRRPRAKNDSAKNDSTRNDSAKNDSGKNDPCARHAFSCEWPRLSEGLNDLKKLLFGSPPNKARRG